MHIDTLLEHPLKALVLAAAVALVCIAAYMSIRLVGTFAAARELIREAVPYVKETSGTGPSMLVLGDSTAVGVGARVPEDSIAGRSAAYLDAAVVENYGVSGAKVADLPEQIARATQPAYDVIIVQIGANDIVLLQGAQKTAKALAETLPTLPDAENVVVMSAGDVGGATGVPFFLRPLYSWLNRQYHAAFAHSLGAAGYTYVNLGTAPRGHLFYEEPETYLAADGFHPSSAGYGVWFEALAPYLMR